MDTDAEAPTPVKQSPRGREAFGVRQLTLLLIRICISGMGSVDCQARSPSPYPLPKEREPRAAALEMSERFRLGDRLTRVLPLLGERVG